MVNDLIPIQAGLRVNIFVSTFSP